MATYTPNLNLKKPGSDDFVDVVDINNNMDKIDTTVGPLSAAVSANTQDIADHTGSVIIHVTSGDKTSWNEKIDKSLITAPGDLIYGSAANTPAKLAKGTDNQVLKITSGLPNWGSNGNDINYELLGTVTTTASQASVEFTGVPTTYEFLKVYCHNVRSDSTNLLSLLMQLDGDTYSDYLYSGGSYSSSDVSSGNSYYFIRDTVPPSSEIPAICEIFINQKIINEPKSIRILSENLYSSRFYRSYGWWANSENRVRSIKLYPNGSGLAAGCIFSLYGGELNG